MIVVAFLAAVWLVLFAIKNWPTPKPIEPKPRYRGYLTKE